MKINENKVFCDRGFYKRLAKGIGKVFIIRKNYKLKEKLKEIKEKIIFVFLFHCQVNGTGKSFVYYCNVLSFYFKIKKNFMIAALVIYTAMRWYITFESYCILRIFF